MQSIDGSAAGQSAAAGTAATTSASPSPQEHFKRQVLKLGMDGSSLPRLVVVADTHVYVCVPSGGITRTIAVCRVERVTLCPHEVADDEEDGDCDDLDVALKRAAAVGGSGSRDPTTPSLKLKRGNSTLSPDFVLAGGGGISGRQKRKAPRAGHTDCADDDIGGAPEGRSAGPSLATSSRQGASLAAAEARSDVPACTAAVRWATVVTLGIAQEAPLVLQFYSAADGEDFVAALRKASHLSTATVFYLPSQEGPIDSVGWPSSSLPARCVDPVVRRVQKREARETDVDIYKPGTGGRRSVGEVQLSPPRSPRSPTAPPWPAAHPGLLSHDNRSGSDGSRGMRSSSEENLRAAGPGQAAPQCLKGADGLPQQRGGDRPRPTSSTAADGPGAEHRWYSLPQAPSTSQETAGDFSFEGNAPSPLRAAPHREAPAPPQQPQLPAPPPLELLRDSTTKERGLGKLHSRDSSDARSLRDASHEAARTPSQERLPRSSYAATSTPPMQEEVPCCPEVPAPVAAQQMSNVPRLSRSDGTVAAAVSTMKSEATSRVGLCIEGLYSKHEVEPIVSSVVAAAPRTSSMATHDSARDAPIAMDVLRAELSAPSAGVARPQRALEAHESLLAELMNAKADVRGLQAALAERVAQCEEWRAVSSQAEQHISGLRRQHERVLAEQEERLRQAHRAELEAVQAAFEEYDSRMTAFVEQLQQDHREEAAQWQHERRTLLFQLNQQQLQRVRDVEEYRRVRAAEVAAQAQYEAQRRLNLGPQGHPRENVHAQQERPSLAVVANALHSPQDGSKSSRRSPLASSMQLGLFPATWSLPGETSPSDALLGPTPPPHTTPPFSAHRLLVSDLDVEGEMIRDRSPHHHSIAATARDPHSYSRSILPASPPRPLGSGLAGTCDAGRGRYTPRRRSYV
ncbi:hypothetical protein GH5_07109 [Leishmania sp. Ghana 2012 LV757]|uniref:hypothetical protein n=1 Tax=Leishmania sp. Ghana 2012 LV757 TaxID=2803181 RepID=UPI001B5502DF|nr:hypothetical protein GH5_07109 [Leishmania sp. Ghana 2012 LV757]